jgi:phosphotransferase system HPr-like phosphotransfer protein
LSKGEKIELGMAGKQAETCLRKLEHLFSKEFVKYDAGVKARKKGM